MSALDTLRAGGKRALAEALAAVEARAEAAATTALLDAAAAEPLGRTIGLTGPPGVGKSTLADALVRHWRAEGLTVGVIAVDPSSALSGGALLGDRTRIATDPGDQGVFLRSMAARDRLGGLAAITFPAMVLMRALFDRVLVETVGVGQSETAVAGLADAVVLCAQPASGDALQFMKAGVMEVPDIVAVTKADLGPLAERTVADLRGALSVTAGARAPEVIACSAQSGAGLAELSHRVAGLALPNRVAQLRHWQETQLTERFGSAVRTSSARLLALVDPARPFASWAALAASLERTIGCAVAGLTDSAVDRQIATALPLTPD